MVKYNKVYRFLFTLLILVLFSPMIVSAQESECGGVSDPFNEACPLDTWVVVLVIVAGVFTSIHLHRKQRSLRS